jgi:hypothetical protein
VTCGRNASSTRSSRSWTSACRRSTFKSFQMPVFPPGEPTSRGRPAGSRRFSRRALLGARPLGAPGRESIWADGRHH